MDSVPLKAIQSRVHTSTTNSVNTKYLCECKCAFVLWGGCVLIVCVRCVCVCVCVYACPTATMLMRRQLEDDTGVNSQTSPVPLPQKNFSSRPNPTKKLGENPVPSTPGRMTPIPSHSRVVVLFFFAEICQLQ